MSIKRLLCIILALCIQLAVVGGPLLRPLPVLATPELPVNLEPSDGATDVSLTPTLRASAFSDPDGDHHVASNWKIEGDTFAKDSGDLTRYDIPLGLLSYSTTYHWQVEYTDNADPPESSGWSSQWSFTTVAAPHADFTAAPTSAQVGETIAFTNASSGGSGPLSCDWSFGDGGTSTDASPTHAYDAADTYTVSLTVTDAAGGDDTMTREGYITITAPSVPPSVTTSAATPVGTTTATLNGDLVDRGTAASVEVSFQWGPTTSYGNTATAPAMTAPGPFSNVLSGLAPATTYHFQAVAEGDGTDYGDDLTFTTSALPDEAPEVATLPASDVGTTSATLNLRLTDMGTAESVTVYFEWGLTASHGDKSAAQTTNGLGEFSVSLTGLSPETTYHFRARADGDGADYGDDLTFTTSALPDEPPEVTTRAASNMGTTSAMLNLSLIDTGTAASVSVYFEWGLTLSHGSTSTAGTRSAPGTFSASLTGLSAGTTYHFRARADGDGTGYGDDLTFTTSALPDKAPEVATQAASNVGTRSATLNLSLTDMGTAESVSVFFEWGLTTSYGNTSTGQSMTDNGAFSFQLSDLSDNTTHHFRAGAAGDGVAYGDDLTFATIPAMPPEVTTIAATHVGTMSATLNGDLSGLGTASSILVSFEWGLTTTYDNASISESMGLTGPFSYSLSDLAPGTTYHFRAKASGDSVAYGVDLTFTTNSTPAVPPAVTTVTATEIGATSATLNGILSSLGSASLIRVSFQWGLAADSGNATSPEALDAIGSFSCVLSNLDPATTYHFRAKAVGDGSVYGYDRTFTTASPADTSALVITEASAVMASTSATVTWITDKPATSQVEYGLTEEYGSTTILDTSLVTYHSVVLTGLEEGQSYRFRVISTDGTANQAVSADATVRIAQPGSGATRWVWPTTGLAVLGLAGAAAYVIRLRRRRASRGQR